MKYLGRTFDIHTGGWIWSSPHHQNEIAQSEGATGQTLSRYWMHNEFINIESVKLQEPRQPAPAARPRRARGWCEERGGGPGVPLFVVTNHYRTTLNFAEEARQGFIHHMDDDLNASPAMAAVFRLVADAGRALSSGGLPAPEALRVSGLIEEVDSVLGVLDETPEAEAVDEGPELPPELGRLAKEREAARRARGWDRADAMRADLEAAGVMVTDTPDGPLWTRKRP